MVGTIRLVLLPSVGTRSDQPIHTTEPFFGKEITLTEIASHVGYAVVVRERVCKVHRSQKGTYFVKFEQTRLPFEGFKVVIFNDYVPAWTAAGVDPRSYEDRYIRVRGVIQVHPKWGIEILVNTPSVIQVVDGPVQHAKGSISGW